jgi:DNA primase
MSEKFRIPKNACAYINKTIDLEAFIEGEVGSDLKRRGNSSSVICPFPDHAEDKSSFHLYYEEEEGLWSFYCWGCGRGGDVIEFFKNYYRVPFLEAVQKICERYNIKDVTASAGELKKAKRKIDVSKKVECAHIIAANQCRMLLRKDYAKHNRWVAIVYKKMEKALDAQDLDYLEEVGFDVSNRMNG